MDAPARNRSPLLWKLSTALALVGIVFTVAARDVAPEASLGAIIAVYLVGAAILVGGVSLAAILGVDWHRFGLNHGATDPAWMWFGGEPPGLRWLRRKQASQDNDGPQPKG